MRIVDPQSALLTNIEVYDFLKNHSLRKQDKKIGAYEPVDLKGYKEVRQDVLRYGTITTPQLTSASSPDQYMSAVVKRLRKYDLTKTEVYSVINLALGLPREQFATTNGNEEHTETGEEAEMTNNDTETVAHVQLPGGDSTEEIPQNDEEIDSTSGIEVLGLIIDSLEERFPEETREKKMTEILAVLRDCVASPSPSAGDSNGGAP